MLCVLLLSASVAADVLTLGDNYKEEFDKNPTKSFCILVYSPYCGHCTHFRPTWKEFVEANQNTTDLVFAEIDGSTQRKAVRSLDVLGFPTVLLVTPDRTRKHVFFGQRSVERLTSFLTENLGSFLIEAKSKEEVDKLIDASYGKTVFVYENREDDASTMSLIRNLTKNFNTFEPVFVWSFAFDKSFTARSFDGENIPYTGDWDEDSLSAFILDNIFPKYALFNQGVVKFCTKSQRKMLVAFEKDHKSQQKLQDMLNQFDTSSIVVASDLNSSLSNAFGIKSAPRIIEFDPSNNKWRSYEGVLTQQALKEWFQTSKPSWISVPGLLNLPPTQNNTKQPSNPTLFYIVISVFSLSTVMISIFVGINATINRKAKKNTIIDTYHSDPSELEQKILVDVDFECE